MRTSRSRPHFLLVGLLSLITASAVHAQGEAVALFADPQVQLSEGGIPGSSSLPARCRPSPITDDGQRADELAVTEQLVIALTSAAERAVEMTIMNERGERIALQSFTAQTGRRAIPVDVSGLAQGRYVALVSNGADHTVVRFRCD